METFKRKL